MSLTKAVQDAVIKCSKSDIELALSVCPPLFRSESNDRLLKLGRRISSLVRDSTDDDAAKLEESLQMLMQECEYISSGEVKVPTVRFGKTDIQMPIVTLGCMRFQQEWGPRITTMDQVGSDCQDNLVAILKTAFHYGITHIETARGYGSSELQLGVALQQIYNTTSIKREDLIIQTKVPPNEDVVAFREALELSFRNLKVDYVDLFAFHGMNFDEQYDWVFGEEKANCLSVVKEYVTAGKIRHVGFSTHGSTDFITKCINTDVFQYVNLHYHYFGSYTASGGGHDGNGNLDCVKLLAEKDIGRFIISPYDKGGRVYAPSKKLRSLTLPEMEPMTFSSLWIWHHHSIYGEGFPQLHTFTVGAARPSDLDQPAVFAYMQGIKPEETLASVKRVTTRLDLAKENSLGKGWNQSWWMGLPKNTASKNLVEHNQIVWMYNCIKAFGMYDFAKARYNSLESNETKWDATLTDDQNIAQKVGKNSWGFVPGRTLKPDTDYTEDLVHVPENNKQRVNEAEEFVYTWCRDPKLDKNVEEGDSAEGPLKRPRGFMNRNVTSEKESATNIDAVPKEWETAYDLRVWPDFPDRPSRNL